MHLWQLIMLTVSGFFFGVLLRRIVHSKSKVEWMIVLLRMLGDGKSADYFTGIFKTVRASNLIPLYDLQSFDSPKSEQDHFALQTLWHREYLMGWSYGHKRPEGRVFLNTRGQFVITYDQGETWYDTGEDDSAWRLN